MSGRQTAPDPEQHRTASEQTAVLEPPAVTLTSWEAFLLQWLPDPPADERAA
jgi:hypothetical protein